MKDLHDQTQAILGAVADAIGASREAATGFWNVGSVLLRRLDTDLAQDLIRCEVERYFVLRGYDVSFEFCRECADDKLGEGYYMSAWRQGGEEVSLAGSDKASAPGLCALRCFADVMDDA